MAGPLKAALDVLRDLRNEIRLVVDHGGSAGGSYRDELDRWYTPLNAFLSIGPPGRRIEEMVALIEAGVLDVIGPADARPRVRRADGGFLAGSACGRRLGGRASPRSSRRGCRSRPAAHRRPAAAPPAGDRAVRRVPHPASRRRYETGGLDVTPRPVPAVDARAGRTRGGSRSGCRPRACTG